MARLRILSLLALAALWCVVPAQAGVWAEFGDAGALLGTAQGAGGGPGPLTQITGRLSAPCCNDVDLYRIYISDPASFSARTVGAIPGATFDTQLFLFSASGLGVESNDDIVAGSQRNSFLTAGNPFAPTTPGIYYLAISAWDNEPFSSGGAIFGILDQGINGPTGLGGAFGLSGWNNNGQNLNEGFLYDIRLTGAEAVPEPGTLLLLGSGISALVVRRRRKSS